jgi:hypothetical protein
VARPISLCNGNLDFADGFVWSANLEEWENAREPSLLVPTNRFFVLIEVTRVCCRAFQKGKQTRAFNLSLMGILMTAPISESDYGDKPALHPHVVDVERFTSCRDVASFVVSYLSNPTATVATTKVS